MPLSSLAPSASHSPAFPPHWPLPASSSSAQTLNTECPQINPQASHSFLFPCSVLFKSCDWYHHKQADDIHVLKFIHLVAYKLSVFCFFSLRAPISSLLTSPVGSRTKINSKSVHSHLCLLCSDHHHFLLD